MSAASNWAAPTYLEVALDRLRGKREAISETYGVELLGIFGSVARGEEADGSDIDILVSVSRDTSLFDLGAVWSELNDAFHRRVDVVDRDMVRPEMRARIEGELVLL